MIPRTEENQVPGGKVRRVAIVFEARCWVCNCLKNLTAHGAGAVPSALRHIGWSQKSGRWHCASCMGREIHNPFKLSEKTHDQH